MAWRFQRRRKLLPGVTLNLGKRSAGTRGVGATLSLLGTGLAYVWRKRR